MKTDPSKTNPDARYRTLLILWFALSMSILMYLAFVQLATVEENPNQKLSLALNTLSLVPVALSFLFKQKILERSVEEQRVDLVQVAYVVSFAFCEVPALLGLVDHFVTGSKYYIVGFSIAGLGMLLHFPLKKNLIAASYRQF